MRLRLALAFVFLAAPLSAQTSIFSPPAAPVTVQPTPAPVATVTITAVCRPTTPSGQMPGCYDPATFDLVATVTGTVPAGYLLRFRNGGTVISPVIASPPYTFAWSGVTAGTYTALRAELFPPAVVSVPPPPSPNPQPSPEPVPVSCTAPPAGSDWVIGCPTNGTTLKVAARIWTQEPKCGCTAGDGQSVSRCFNC